ncbi:MAG: ABC transporter ATP-binding protein, partial [Oscillospiraceae bacterium]
PLLENEDFNNAKQAAIYSSYDDAHEGIYGCYERIGTSVLGFIIFAAMLAYVNPFVLLITASTTLIGYFARQWANNWRFMHSDEFQKNWRKIRYLNRIGFDYKASKDIRLFSMLNWLTDVFKVSERIAINLNKKLYKYFFFADLADCVGTFIREGISYGYLIWKVINNEIRVDDFVLLFSAINTFSGYIVGILSEFSNLIKYNIDYSKGIEYFEYKNIFKAEDGENINKSENNEYKIELKNVSFKYNGAEDYTLKNINLTIKAGEKLAVVGLNGAGKTTLVKLICGFYDPTEGEVLLNGKNVKDFNRNQYYDLFTAVFQHFNILPLTIAENIAIGYNEIDKEKLYECFKLADIDKKINSLPLQENSLLVKDCYDEAIDLSGGETQRLMLARALYKNSPILILDEPTAALDPIAESRMYEQYNNLAQGKTSIYISHRLASTRFCDRIIFISNNKIAESGTHQELLNLGNEYANLYNIQSKY